MFCNKSNLPLSMQKQTCSKCLVNKRWRFFCCFPSSSFFHPSLSILIPMRFVPHQRCVYFRPYNCFCHNNNNKFEQVFLPYPYTRSVKVQWRVFEKLFTDFRDCFDRVDYYDLLACAKSRFQPIPSAWLGY